MALQNSNPTTTNSWQNLKNHFLNMENNSIKELFQNDSQRATKFHIQWNDFLVDYSKNNITKETLDLLLKLTEEINLKEAISKYFGGDAINQTENRAVLHSALRAPESATVLVDGKNVIYGSLGDFASQFDQSAQRNYLEEGYLRTDPSNVDSKQFEVLMQQPSATILIKKRMFGSVADNYRPEFMDQDEKIYYKAMTYLFQNKCKQISTLEKLSKIQQISSALGSVDDQLMSILFTLSSDIGFLGAPAIIELAPAIIELGLIRF